MHLTNFTDYTLRVLIYLGMHQHEGRLVTISEVATAYGISENHLMKIVHHLAKRGCVETIRGKGGGMRLARAPEQVNLGDVVRDAENDPVIVKCSRQYHAADLIAPACALAEILGQAMRAFFDNLDRHTLADLLESQQIMLQGKGDAAAEIPPGASVPDD